MKIALIGARGVANYGGFETLVSELAPRLVERGFEVYCSCEKDGEMPSEYKGAKLIYFPVTMPSNYQIRKILEFFYDIYFGFICSFTCDRIYFLGFSANLFTFFPRMLGKKSFMNMAGVEWERSKFSKRERALLRFFFKLAVIGSNYVIIDNEKLINYIDKKYHHKVIYITYGVAEIPETSWDPEIASRYTKISINPDEYWLAVARLQPDNNIETILEGFITSESKQTLIIIGDISCDYEYEQSINHILKDHPDRNIILTGGIYDQEHLNIFRQNCFGYIHAHSIGGTNPSLLEAMVLKNIIIAHDNQFNREVADDSTLYFRDFNELGNQIKSVEDDRVNYMELGEKAYQRVKEKFLWSKIVDEYEQLFKKV